MHLIVVSAPAGAYNILIVSNLARKRRSLSAGTVALLVIVWFRFSRREGRQMNLVNHSLDAIAAALVATGGPFDPVTCFVGVATAITDLGVNTVLSDLVQATGGLATRQEVTAWDGPYELAGGKIGYQGPLMTFSSTSGDTPQTLQAWYVASLGTGGVLVAYGRIIPPVPIPDDLTPWNIVLRVVADPNGTWGAEVTFNG